MRVVEHNNGLLGDEKKGGKVLGLRTRAEKLINDIRQVFRLAGDNEVVLKPGDRFNGFDIERRNKPVAGRRRCDTYAPGITATFFSPLFPEHYDESTKVAVKEGAFTATGVQLRRLSADAALKVTSK